MSNIAYVHLPDLILHNPVGLFGLFSGVPKRPSNLIQQYILEKDIPVLIVDINHRWSSLNLNQRSRIFQPNTLSEVLDIIQNLPFYIHPKLSFLFIDDLPLYFRDFYGSDKLYTQNLRLFGYCLALLKELSKTILVMYTTYANALNISFPIYKSHAEYYSDRIYKIKSITGNLEIV